MKRRLYAAAMLAVLLSLSACGKTPDSTIQQTEQRSEAMTIIADSSESWMQTLAEELFEKYGVLPEYHEDLGNGLYQVYVEVGGEILPFGTVNAATGEFHN